MVKKEIFLTGKRNLLEKKEFNLRNSFYLIKKNETIRNFISNFEKVILEKNFDIAIALSDNKRLKGIISLGDLRRLVNKKVDQNHLIINYLNKKPITVREDDLTSNLYSKLYSLKKNKNKKISKVIVLDENKKFKTILDYKDIETNYFYKNVCIIGLGHIGIPLALHLLKKTSTVYGIDKDKRKIQDLKKLRLNFYEKNLYESFIFNLKQKKLLISSDLNKISEIYIVCLGTKFEKKKIDNKDLFKLAQQLGKKIKENDLVILRGTVQLGTTRNIFLKGLKKSTKLICGKDYYLSYMPERLVEGNALAEMETIPTLVSGFSKNCLNNALNFTKFYFSNYLPLSSFEEAEIIKLASNTYRDFKFAFANEISRIANLNNLSGAELIRKANFGYSRNDIPKPSLGVGGFCLPKDPYLFNKSVNNQGNFKLDFNSRKINDNALDHHCKKIKKIFNLKKSIIGKNVLICGISFKGYPETLDTRNSPALILGKNLKKNNFKLTFIDPLSKMFKKNRILKNFKIVEKIKNLEKFDGIIIVNNHEFFLKTITNNLKINQSKKRKIVFDTWGILDKDFVEKNNWEYYKI